MPNQAAIDEHSANAESLAERYRTQTFESVFPDESAYLREEAAKGHKLHILDIGCGIGNYSQGMAQLGHHVVGVEPSNLRAIA